MTSTNDIRRSFLDYFSGLGHRAVASASLLPHNDPTLMFVNAGMVPFKNVFTGLETRPYVTAVSAQKCVRAGGKHNDLDNVGYTARHHTFFEMLGNFSFGDYFKEQAIYYAWQLITKEWGLDRDRLTVTVYHDDQVAFDLWQKIAGLSATNIIRISTTDNFWSMGDTGPCGPCSEIFYDHGAHIAGGPPGSPDQDGDRFVEIWNLVFMQYEQTNDGRNALPRPSIDTGMGLERIAAVMQGVHDNYDTDTFAALIAESGHMTKSDTAGPMKSSHRIIADHLRTSGFLIADGVLPANEGRGYVLRRIMRRAMRHAHLLGTKDPLMHRLVPSLIGEMGSAYPELVRAQPLIEATLAQEEMRFRTTLTNGLRLLDDAVSSLSPGDTLAGETAFKLYDTYGFPYDLTEDALRAQNLSVDRGGFDKAMAVQKAAARAAWKGSGEQASSDIWFDIADEHGGTEFTGYAGTVGEGQIIAIIRDGGYAESVAKGESALILTNQTPFYAESGGQMGDAGTLSGEGGGMGAVNSTAKPLGRLHAHDVSVTAGTFVVGQAVTMTVDAERRRRIRANHSATHLLHAALRRQFGSHVTQKGSLVADDRLRFDFSHAAALSDDDIAAVERDVNAHIRGNAAVSTQLMTPDDAIAAGAMALFGEKYGEEVRVLSMGASDDGAFSVELCGGTHVDALGDIALFKIVSESAVSSGVRRIEALTGEAARLWLVRRDEQLKKAAATLRSAPEDVPARVIAMADTVRQLERELGEARKALALGTGHNSGSSGPETIAGVLFSHQIINNLDPKDLRGLVDSAKQAIGSGIVMMIALNDGRAAVAIGVTADLSSRFDSIELVRVAVARLGGSGGGGRPDMAQGGGPAGDKAADAVADVRAMIVTAV